jgi:hypothetical protein
VLTHLIRKEKAMAFQLFVRFTGLCGFVPNTSGKRMRVVLVDAGEAAMKAMGNMEMPAMPGMEAMPMEAMEAHQAALVFDDGDRVSGDGETFKQNGKTMRLRKLDGLDVSIAPSSEDALTLVSPEVNGCPNKTTATSLAYLAQIDKILPAAGGIHPDCLAKPPKVSPKVAARIWLTDGTLRTLHLSSLANFDPIRWSFDEGGHEQVLAEVIELETKIEGDKVTFHLNSFRNPGAAIAPIVLRPQTPGKSVEVRIENMPLQDIQGTREVPLVVQIGKPRSRDRHFPIMYTLTQNGANGSRPVPLAVDQCSGVDLEPPHPPTAGSPQCPGTAFPPNTSA